MEGDRDGGTCSHCRVPLDPECQVEDSDGMCSSCKVMWCPICHRYFNVSISEQPLYAELVIPHYDHVGECNRPVYHHICADHYPKGMTLCGQCEERKAAKKCTLKMCHVCCAKQCPYHIRVSERKRGRSRPNQQQQQQHQQVTIESDNDNDDEDVEVTQPPRKRASAGDVKERIYRHTVALAEVKKDLKDRAKRLQADQSRLTQAEANIRELLKDSRLDADVFIDAAMRSGALPLLSEMDMLERQMRATKEQIKTLFERKKSLKEEIQGALQQKE